MKKTLSIVIAILIIAVGAYFLMQQSPDLGQDTNQQPAATTTEDQNGDQGTTTTDAQVPEATTTQDMSQNGGGNQTVLGTSAGGHDIVAHHYGEGDNHVIFVGGIHGGYSWNTSLLAYRMMNYFEQNPDSIPENVRATVIPVMNPDGLNEVLGVVGEFTMADAPSSGANTVPGRFNANGVDINRNFDCNWQSTGQWQDRTVDAGDTPFSEPESQAFRDYVNAANPDGVVVYYSAAGGVYSSSCNEGVMDETATLNSAYSQSSGYPSYEEFDAYEITGDAVDWLAKNDIPGISVLLSNHRDIEWDMNRAGIDAVLDHYSE